MKMYNKEITVISMTETDGTITPIKWRIMDEAEGYHTYKILKVMKRQKRRIAGHMTYELLCETEINGSSRPCELRYNIESSQWKLFKI